MVPHLITLLLLLCHGLLHGSWLAQVVTPIIYEAVQGDPELHATAASIWNPDMSSDLSSHRIHTVLVDALAPNSSEHAMAAVWLAPEQCDWC